MVPRAWISLTLALPVLWIAEARHTNKTDPLIEGHVTGSFREADGRDDEGACRLDLTADADQLVECLLADRLGPVLALDDHELFLAVSFDPNVDLMLRPRRGGLDVVPNDSLAERGENEC